MSEKITEAKKEEELPKSQEVPSDASGDQNQITGLQVAAGRAGWEKYGEKESDAGYVFKQNRGFVLKVDKAQLDTLGVSMEALLDCMKQLEALGSAEELKKKYSFRKNQGFVNPGIVVVSKDDPRIKMAVTLHDPDYENTDVLLGWFVDDERLDQEMKVVNPKHQPERAVDPDELKSVERAREALSKKENKNLSPEELLLGLNESFENNSIEMFRTNKAGYLQEGQGGNMDAKRLNEMKEAGVKIVDAGAGDKDKPGIHLVNPSVTQLEEASERALEEGFDRIYVHRAAYEVKRTTQVDNLFEGVDDPWGLPNHVLEAEGTPMAAGKGIGEKGKTVGTALDEKPAGKPEHAKDPKAYDKEVDKLDGAPNSKKDDKILHVDAKGQIEKPHSEVGKDYGASAANKANQLGDPKDGMGDHMQGKGNSSSQTTGVPSSKVKPGKVDATPKHVGEATDAADMKDKVDNVKAAGSGEPEPEMDERKKRMAEWKKKRMESLKAKREAKGDKSEEPKEPKEPKEEPKAAEEPKDPPVKEDEEEGGKGSKGSKGSKEPDAMLRRKLPEWAKKKA